MNITKDVVDLTLSDFRQAEIWVWCHNPETQQARVNPVPREIDTWRYEDHEIFFTKGRLIFNDGSQMDALVTVRSSECYICLVTVFKDQGFCDIPLDAPLRDSYELRNFTEFLQKKEEDIFPMRILVNTTSVNLTIEQIEKYPYLE